MYKEEGYQLMGAAFEVYNEIGYGMAEEIYQQSLEIEMSLRNIPFLTKQELEVFYKGRSNSRRKRLGVHSSWSKEDFLRNMEKTRANYESI
jgi:GxxExxY protein